ncbi:ribbon-helix-helix domain-containing protein [Parasegetibacter sp. NRK P23]|uniref:ribbon-helix-helix domain-containing protein n=1 Tax=Parasegetibacter sp. NRK P23 TaxID=2942999 RepID=UPI002043D3D5|nr:ribbon-helix-helix domain-containing protein [Parasegetibacter sp. NRK P23]MCM5528761.1 ribbon-helix-helix domain-containing protein [Parasegetibacter sp. NRK P23]
MDKTGEIFKREKVYTDNIYLYGNGLNMKTLSLKLDEAIFEEAEAITSKMHLPRNRYINEAVKAYNIYNKRRLLKQQLVRESGLVAPDSMEVLREFEKMFDGNTTV